MPIPFHSPTQLNAAIYPRCFTQKLSSSLILQTLNEMLFAGHVIKGGLYHSGGEAVFAVLRTDAEDILFRVMSDIEEYRQVNNRYHPHVDAADWIGLSYLIEKSERVIHFNRNKERFEYGAPLIHTKFL